MPRDNRAGLPSPTNPHDCTDEHSEDQNQAALFRWVNMAVNFGVEVANDRRSWEERGFAAAHSRLPPSRVAWLRWLFAVPNGAHLASAKHGAVMRARGVRNGVPDLCLPVAVRPYHGLWIEMKSPGGRVSVEQKEWLDHLTNASYSVKVVVGWRSARDVLLDYTKGI